MSFFRSQFITSISPPVLCRAVINRRYLIFWLILFSGYFIYDAIDMAMNNLKKSTYELLVHHFLVSWATFWVPHYSDNITISLNTFDSSTTEYIVCDIYSS